MGGCIHENVGVREGIILINTKYLNKLYAIFFTNNFTFCFIFFLQRSISCFLGFPEYFDLRKHIILSA